MNVSRTEDWLSNVDAHSMFVHMNNIFVEYLLSEFFPCSPYLSLFFSTAIALKSIMQSVTAGFNTETRLKEVSLWHALTAGTVKITKALIKSYRCWILVFFGLNPWYYIIPLLIKFLNIIGH